MKNALAQITQHSAVINAGLAKIAGIDADILRATEAILEADKIVGELEALSKQRAELKARAFVAKTVADTAELDKQEKALARAGRQAVEDGQAAAIAIEMLKENRTEIQSEIEAVSEQRKEVVIAWLADHRDKAIKRYIAVLNDLGAPLAEAYAVDKLLAELDSRDSLDGDWLLKQVRYGGVIVPHSHKVERVDTGSTKPIYDAPVAWLRDEALGEPESAKLLEDLRGAGLEMTLVK
ncbi:hypothetical protein KV580_22095 [Pseudomonas chlororaphis]|nr:hypothetical protein [Pseudomonas chlororaphis]